MTVSEWLEETHVKNSAGIMIRPKAKCRDGFVVSIQASEFHYSTPRMSDIPPLEYTAVELGYPSEKDDMLLPWAESDNSAVYAQVPIELAEILIDKHGGIK